MFRKYPMSILLRCSTPILAICMVFVAFGSHATPRCLAGDKSIQLTILPPSGVPLSLHLGTAYFDQRSIPQDGTTRGALFILMQATDFAPWPPEIRPHTSEGPLLMYLLTPLRTFEEVADARARLNAGYGYAETVVWADAQGPYDLSVPAVPPPAKPEGGPFTGADDIYIARDEVGAMTDIISCARPGRTPFQTCQHLIEAGEMDIKISYAPEFLPDWKRLSTGATEFLRCMEGN